MADDKISEGKDTADEDTSEGKDTADEDASGGPELTPAEDASEGMKAAGEDELRKELREMNEKMSNLEYALGEITRPYGDIIQHMDRLRNITEGYFRIIDLYRRHGRVSPDLLLPEVKDPISQEIINILFEKPELNVSQIADLLKDRRGTASRKTVRDKLAFLDEIGAIEILDDKKIRRYKVSDDMQERWLKVLGLTQ